MRTDDADPSTIDRAQSRTARALDQYCASHQLCDVIVRTLDRDDALRRTYLRSRWQGDSESRPDACGRPPARLSESTVRSGNAE